MRIRTLAALICSIPMVAAAGQSSSHGADFSLGVRAGTLGIGAEAAKLVTGHIGLRASINFFSDSFTKVQSNITFGAKVKLKAFTGLLDLFPSNRGSFHLSGGIITNPVEVTAGGIPSSTGTYTINNNTYTAAQVGTFAGSGKYGSTLPYVGIGWGTPAARKGGFKLKFDLGAAIGKPTILLSASNQNAQLQSDVAAQQAKTQTDVNKYAKVYPVISMGLVYRF